MDEIFKTLLESPGKIKGSIVWVCRILLSVLTTAWLYEKVFGSYTLIQLNDLNAWAEFLISGRVLICLLLFWICNHVLFELLSTLSYLLFQSVADRFTKDNGMTKAIAPMLIWSMKKYRLLKIDARNDIIELMERSDQLHEYVTKLSEREGKEDLWDLRDSYLNDIGHTFIIFTILYFTILHSVPHTAFVSWLIVIIFLNMLLLCASVGILTDIIQKIAPELSEMIHFAKIEHLAKTTFTGEGWFVHTRELKNGKSYACFYYAGKHVILKFLRRNRVIYRHDIESAVNDANENETLVLLFAHKPLQVGIENDIKNIQHQVLFTQLPGIDNTKDIITALIKERFPEDKNIFLFEPTDQVK